MKLVLALCLIVLNTHSTVLLNSNGSSVVKYRNNKIAFGFETKLKNIKITFTKENTWIRLDSSIIIPKARINIQSNKKYTYRYINEYFYSQETKSKIYSHFFVSPFIENSIEVIENNKVIGKIKLQVKSQHQIYTVDKSCNSVSFKFKNINKAPLIIGCSFRESKSGERDLKLSFLHLNSKRIKTSFVDNKSVLSYIDKDEGVDIQIKPKYKNKTKKLAIALGFGPYGFNTSVEDKNMDAVSAAVMLYSNYKFNKDTSIRAFSASIFDVSSFHNFGLYLANDLAYLDDADLVITSLLGVQYLDYRFNSTSKKFSSPLYPQGVEVTYKNLFKNKNYIISGGVFVNPTDSSDYQNAWIRWGEKYYYELNYINWSSKEFKANMWGLSLIIPVL